MEFQTMPLQPIRLVVQEVNSGEVSIISLVRGASLLFEAVTATAHAFGLSPSQVRWPMAGLCATVLHRIHRSMT